jgi:hypothetical protein
MLNKVSLMIVAILILTACIKHAGGESFDVITRSNEIHEEWLALEECWERYEAKCDIN